MGFRCGIIGLPNVGKSTLFNALTKTAAAQAANYPFCTIEPNVGRVSVPDPRLNALAQIAGSKELLPTQLEFVDIAGLVRGASKGEGLGNQFLAHIREVDAVVHVVRSFESETITHVEGSVDPLRDIGIIDTELLLADLESLERRIANLEKKAKGGDKESKETLELCQKILPLLQAGKPARSLVCKDDAEKFALKNLQLLTSKPVLYACNVSEQDASGSNPFVDIVRRHAQEENAGVVVISAAIEAEVASLESEEDKLEFLQSMGLEETGLSKVIHEGYKLLDLITFFTVGPKEARAWTVRKNSTAPQAAGEIHTDFEKGFIRAETISYEDYTSHNGEQGAKAAGKMLLEGKEYIAKDGDIFHFRFNV